MSIFPSKLRPGNTVTLHLRVTPTSPVWVHKKDFLVAPDGKKIPIWDRVLPLLPVDFDEEEFEMIRRSDIGFQSHPILMAARYLALETKDLDFFVDMLTSLRDATHIYPTYHVPEDAPLGRYDLVSETYHNGSKSGSTTGKYDFFIVEQLRMSEFLKSGTAAKARVENASPEPVLAQLCDPSEDTAKRVRLLELPPKSITEILLRGAGGFLVYCGGSEVLRLGPAGDLFCIRNQAVRTLRKPNGVTFLCPTRELPERGFELDDAGKQIWELAGGFNQKSSVRTKSNADRYDKMLEAGLIMEVDP